MARMADPNIKAVYLTAHSTVYDKTEIQKVVYNKAELIYSLKAGLYHGYAKMFGRLMNKFLTILQHKIFAE